MRAEEADYGASLSALTDQEIEQAVKDDPDAAPILDDEWFRHARLVMPERKQLISLRLDREVVDWFKRQGVLPDADERGAESFHAPARKAAPGQVGGSLVHAGMLARKGRRRKSKRTVSRHKAKR